MPWDRAATDAVNRILGYSQEELDAAHQAADEYRAELAKRGPLPPYEPAESDTDPEDGGATLLSPPPTPNHEEPDLSKSAWSRCVLADLARGKELGECGHKTYEEWQSKRLNQLEQERSLSGSSSAKSMSSRRHRAFSFVSDRLMWPSSTMK